MKSFGAIKEKSDERDFIIGDYLPEKIYLPSHIDLSLTMSPVRDQGEEPICVAMAAAAVKESEELEITWFSPRFIYDRIAQPQGGAYIRDAMKVLNKKGICTEKCQPFISNQKTPPCETSEKDAYINRIKGYARLKTVEDMKRCLAKTGSFVAAFYINSTWEKPDNTGIVYGSGEIIGGHAVAVCGYDDSIRFLKFKNSWGREWGDAGYGYISYTDAEKSLMDAWSSVDIPEQEEQIEQQSRPKSFWERFMDWLRA